MKVTDDSKVLAWLEESGLGTQVFVARAPIKLAGCPADAVGRGSRVEVAGRDTTRLWK